MQPRTRRQNRIVAAATVVSAALGAVFARRSPDWTAATLSVGIVTGHHTSDWLFHGRQPLQA